MIVVAPVSKSVAPQQWRFSAIVAPVAPVAPRIDVLAECIAYLSFDVNLYESRKAYFNYKKLQAMDGLSHPTCFANLLKPGATGATGATALKMLVFAVLQN